MSEAVYYICKPYSSIVTLDRKNVTSTIHPVNQVFDYKKQPTSSKRLLGTTVTTKFTTADNTSKQWIQLLRHGLMLYANIEFQKKKKKKKKRYKVLKTLLY